MLWARPSQGFRGGLVMDFVSGSEVMARGAIRAGCRAFFGYPITPSSEIMALMAEELPKVNGVFMQMEDEIAASAAAIGASWAGAKSMTATSGPGFSLMQENIGMATMLEIPLVIVDVQRVGPSTGIPTMGAQQDLMQSIWGRHGDQLTVVFSPSSFDELFTMTVRAFNLAEELRIPLILLTDGHMVTLRSLADLRHPVDVTNRKHLTKDEASLPFRPNGSLVPGFPRMGEELNVLFDTLVHNERGYPTANSKKARRLLKRLREKVEASIDRVWDCEQSGPQDSDTLVVSYGSSAISARYAVNLALAEGDSVSLLVMKSLWPLNERELSRVFEGRKRVIIVEQALGQLAWLVRPYVEKGSKLIESTSIGRPPDPFRLLKLIRGGA